MLNVAVIGTGRAGRVHCASIAFHVPDATLIAVADNDAESAREAASEFGAARVYRTYQEVLDDKEVDAVIIVLPTSLHAEVTVAAADAGKHVLCEKPMAITVDECDRMIAHTERNNVKLQIGFMRRFDRNFMAAREAIDRGDIGSVVMVRSLTHGPSTPRDWMYDVARSNGPLAEVNSHDIDTVRWFTGSEFSRVHAIAGNYRCTDVRDRYPLFYDNVVMTSSLENGAQAVVEGAVAVRYGYDARAEVLGTEGTLFVGRLPANDVVICRSDNRSYNETVGSWRDLFVDAYRREDESFVSCILNDTTPVVTGLDGKKAVETVRAGNKSIQEQKSVDLRGE